MRIHSDDLDTTLSILRDHFGEDIDVYLFGSRVQDKGEGGDYDFFLEVPEPINHDFFRRFRRAKAELWDYFGDANSVDLVYSSKLEPRSEEERSLLQSSEKLTN